MAFYSILTALSVTFFVTPQQVEAKKSLSAPKCLVFIAKKRRARSPIMRGVLLKRKNFPRHNDLPISDPDLRRAIYEVFDGRDFYTGKKISFSKMHIDHVWAQNKGGPDNIYNYVLTGTRTNIKKSDHHDPVAISAALAYVRTVYAPAVIARVEELKAEKRQRKPLPQIQETLERDLRRSLSESGLTGNDIDYIVTGLKRNHLTPKTQLEDFSRFIGNAFSNLRRKDQNWIRKSSENRRIFLQAFHSIWKIDKSFQTNPNGERAQRLWSQYSFLGKHLVTSLELLNSNRRYFGQSHSLYQFFEQATALATPKGNFNMIPIRLLQPQADGKFLVSTLRILLSHPLEKNPPDFKRDTLQGLSHLVETLSLDNVQIALRQIIGSPHRRSIGTLQEGARRFVTLVRSYPNRPITNLGNLLSP